ncbi:cation transporter [bacterium]|nr:cation transporter [bacterium]MBL7052185.1 cation transporter [Candidatus Neomarinimicrobiota bacterium]
MHTHSHSGGASALKYPIVVLFATFLVEIVGGIVFHSLSLVGDSMHVFSDIFALGIAYGAIVIANRKTPDDQFVHGYHRLEVLSALVNGMLLVGIAVFLIMEAIDRFQNPHEVNAKFAIWIAIFGLLVNLSVLAMLHKSADHKHDINIKAAYLHVLGDSLASISVIVGMILIILSGNPIWDSIVSLVICALIIYASARVILEGTNILMHRSPRDLEEIRCSMLEIQHVQGVEELRLWQVCSHLTVGTAHIITDLERLAEIADVSKLVKAKLRGNFDIRHLILEFETPEAAANHSHDFDHNH